MARVIIDEQYRIALPEEVTADGRFQPGTVLEVTQVGETLILTPVGPDVRDRAVSPDDSGGDA